MNYYHLNGQNKSPDKRCYVIKLISIMFFLSGIVFNTYAHPYLQIRIDLKYKDILIKDVFMEIEKRSDYIFLFSGNLEEEINRKIDVDISSDSIEEILECVMKNTSLKYEILDKQIVVFNKAHRPKAEPTEEIRKISVQQSIKTVFISGKVMDEKEEPIVGANVIVPGTTIGTVTDKEGKFALNVPKGSVLRFSYIGYIPSEVIVSEQKTLNIRLKEKKQALDEVVVTGYANIRKESFTGSVTQINREDILKVSQNNIIKAIEIFEPALKMLHNNEMGSNPNVLPEFYIRGRSGTPEIKELDMLTADDISMFALSNNPSAPIFILDGFEVNISTIYDLDLNRIESINILKDAAATAVYGSRAANGVIIIETTTPKPGEIHINYAGNFFINIPDLRSYNLLNAEEILEAEYLAGLYNGNSSSGKAAGIINYTKHKNAIIQGINTKWISKPLRREFNHKHFLNFEGGTQNLRWGVDLNTQKNGGVMKGSFRNINGIAINLDYRYRRFQIKNKIAINTMSSEDSPFGNFSDYVKMKPYFSPYNENSASYTNIFKQFYTTMPPGGIYIKNPLYEASLHSYKTDKYKNFTDNLSLIWYINSDWVLRGTYSIFFRIEDLNSFIDPQSGEFANVHDPTMKGKLSKRELRNHSWNANMLIAYNRQIKKHNLNFSFGIEAAENIQKGIFSYFRGFPNGNLSSMADAINIENKPTYKENTNRRFGSYLQFNYNLKNIYLFDISGRLDGASNFGTKKKIGDFWSFGAGINTHNYEFIKNIPFLNQLKLKITYGQTGKANFSAQQARTTYEILTDEDYTGSFGIVLKALGNEKLKWEKVKTLNIGTETAFLKNSIMFKIDFYRAKTLDQVESLSIPSSSGFQTYKGNIGQVLNKGVDVVLNIRTFQNRNWSIYCFINANSNKNRILKIGTALQNYNERIDHYFSKLNSYDIKASKPFLKYEKGNSLSAIYGMKSLGIDPSIGYELFVNRDGSITYTWQSKEQQRLGDSEPKIRGSFGINLSYKNFSLYTTFLYRYGGQTYNQTLQAIENIDLSKWSGDRRILTDKWKKYGDVTPLKRLDITRNITRPTSRFVQNENTLSFSSMTFGYDFKQELIKKWRISSLRLQFNMEDIAYFSTIKRERGTSYPFSHAFNFNLNLSF